MFMYIWGIGPIVHVALTAACIADICRLKAVRAEFHCAPAVTLSSVRAVRAASFDDGGKLKRPLANAIRESLVFLSCRVCSMGKSIVSGTMM